MNSPLPNRFAKGLSAAAVALTIAFGVSVAPVHAGPENNTLVVGSAWDPGSLDPAIGTLGSDIPLLYPMFDRLIGFDPKTLDPIPGLATSWTWSSDRKALELKLRQGVTFHDGTPFNAQAVKTSLRYFIDGKRNRDLDDVTEIATPDPYTVVINLSKPNTSVVGLLAERAGMIISPAAIEKHGEQNLGQNPVGTGPYMLKVLEPGKSVQYVRYPGYWDKSAAKLDAIEFRVIRNATSIVSALQSGQLDYVAQIDPVNLPVLQKNSRLRVAIEPTVAFGIINLANGFPPLNDRRVRRALALSVDRQVLADAAFGGGVKGIPASLPVPAGYWTSTKDLENALTYRPDEAKKLLAEAGYPDGIDFEICVVASMGTPLPTGKLGDIMREQMKASGIRVKTVQTASNVACSALSREKKIHTFVANWSGRPDPAITYAQLMGSETAFNRDKGKYDNADEIIEKLMAAPSREEQMPYYEALNRIWIEHMPLMPLYYYVNVVAYSTKLAGEEPNLLGRPYVQTLYFKK
jgi:ABC-type transport system substrate-binding protein